MDLWFNPKSTQGGPHPIHLPLQGQEGAQGHGFQAVPEASSGNEAASKIDHQADSPVRLSSGTHGRGDGKGESGLGESAFFSQGSCDQETTNWVA